MNPNILLTLIVCVIIIVVLLIAGIRIVPADNAVIVHRLGKYHKTLQTGFNFIIPFIDTTLPPVSLLGRAAEFHPSTIKLNGDEKANVSFIILFKVFDVKLFTYTRAKPLMELEAVTFKIIRETLSNYTYDQLVSSRTEISTQIQTALDTEMQELGIKINQFEIEEDIERYIPPVDM